MQAALEYFEAPLKFKSALIPHEDRLTIHEESCSTNRRSITLSPSSEQLVKSDTEFFSNMAEIVVSVKQVAANICQNAHSSSGGPAERSQRAETASIEEVFFKHLVLRKITRSPGKSVVSSTMPLNAWHCTLADSALRNDYKHTSDGENTNARQSIFHELQAMLLEFRRD